MSVSYCHKMLFNKPSLGLLHTMIMNCSQSLSASAGTCQVMTRWVCWSGQFSSMHLILNCDRLIRPGSSGVFQSHSKYHLLLLESASYFCNSLHRVMTETQKRKFVSTITCHSSLFFLFLSASVSFSLFFSFSLSPPFLALSLSIECQILLFC